MTQFLSELDLQIVRMSSEIMFLQQVVEAQKEENSGIIANLKITVEAKEAVERHAKALELQIDRMKEQLEAVDYYHKEAQKNGQKKVLRRTSKKP